MDEECFDSEAVLAASQMTKIAESSHNEADLSEVVKKAKNLDKKTAGATAQSFNKM